LSATDLDADEVIIISDSEDEERTDTPAHIVPSSDTLCNGNLITSKGVVDDIHLPEQALDDRVSPPQRSADEAITDNNALKRKSDYHHPNSIRAPEIDVSDVESESMHIIRALKIPYLSCLNNVMRQYFVFYYSGSHRGEI